MASKFIENSRLAQSCLHVNIYNLVDEIILIYGSRGEYIWTYMTIVDIYFSIHKRINDNGEIYYPVSILTGQIDQ